jgi:uncharacterized protein (TIGR03000 family)
MYSVVLMAALTTTAAEAPACHRSCHGYSACYGCSGCYGGCRGGWGGCYGGCWGGGYGSCYGSFYGCHGCYGCYGCYGCSGYAPVMVAPSGPPTMPPAGGAAPAPPPKPSGSGALPTKAKLIVNLPSDAKLYIDGQLMKTTSAVRSFNTPALDQGQLYYYEVRAEVMRDGKPVTENKRVIVRAGEEVKTSFPGLESAAAEQVTAVGGGQ